MTGRPEASGLGGPEVSSYDEAHRLIGRPAAQALPNRLAYGLIAVAKLGCPTCVLIEPLLRQLADSAAALTVYTQDDPAFAAGDGRVIYDDTLEASLRLAIEIVPTLIKVEGGREVERTYGWHRGDWQRITGRADLGQDLPALRPGCGSKTLEPGIAEDLTIRFGDTGLTSRKVEIGDAEDPIEACYERGWSDGMPVVPPTQARVLRMSHSDLVRRWPQIS